jgi:hypothetical protein
VASFVHVWVCCFPAKSCCFFMGAMFCDLSCWPCRAIHSLLHPCLCCVQRQGGGGGGPPLSPHQDDSVSLFQRKPCLHAQGLPSLSTNHSLPRPQRSVCYDVQPLVHMSAICETTLASWPGRHSCVHAGVIKVSLCAQTSRVHCCLVLFAMHYSEICRSSCQVCGCCTQHSLPDVLGRTFFD